MVSALLMVSVRWDDEPTSRREPAAWSGRDQIEARGGGSSQEMETSKTPVFALPNRDSLPTMTCSPSADARRCSAA